MSIIVPDVCSEDTQLSCQSLLIGGFMNRNSSVFIAALLIAGLSLLAGCGGGGGGSNQSGPPASGSLIWAQISSPTNTNTAFNDAEAFAVVVDQGAMYVAGYDDSNPSGYDNWRIEKRSLADGALVVGFNGGGVVSYPSASVARHYVALAMAKDSSSLYVGGYECPDYDAVTGLPVNAQWRIEKRDLATGLTVTAFDTDGVVTSITSTWDNEVNAIAVDETHGSMYVVGYDTVSNPTASVPEWRIEKRNLITGATVTTFGAGSGFVTSSPNGGEAAIAYAIAIDSTAGYMYVAGYDTNITGGIRTECRIEKRSLDTGDPVASFGTPTTSGYVVTDLNGNGLDCVLNAIAIDSQFLYVAGYDTGSGSPEWRIEKRDLTSGTLDVVSFGTPTVSGTTGYITSDPSSGDDTAYSIALDIANNALYVTGSQDITTPSPLNWEWRIEKRDLLSGATITAFGTNGAVVENPSIGDDVPSAIALIPTDPYIYIAGHSDYSATTSARWLMEKRQK